MLVLRLRKVNRQLSLLSDSCMGRALTLEILNGAPGLLEFIGSQKVSWLERCLHFMNWFALRQYLKSLEFNFIVKVCLGHFQFKVSWIAKLSGLKQSSSTVCVMWCICNLFFLQAIQIQFHRSQICARYVIVSFPDPLRRHKWAGKETGYVTVLFTQMSADV